MHAVESDRIIRTTLKAVQKSLGPLGRTDGKKGLSLEFFRLLVHKVHALLGDSLGQPVSLLYLRDLTWLMLSFCGFLRRTEAINLNLEDVLCHNSPPHLTIFLRRSKTDVLGRGMYIHIAWILNCGLPIRALVSVYLTRVRSVGYPPNFPLFMNLGLTYGLNCQTSTRLAKDTMSGRSKLYLSLLAGEYPHLGIQSASYSSHSLRRGGASGASAAWQAGVPKEMIARHGRWQSEAIELYLVANVDLKIKVTAAI